MATRKSTRKTTKKEASKDTLIQEEEVEVKDVEMKEIVVEGEKETTTKGKKRKAPEKKEKAPAKEKSAKKKGKGKAKEEDGEEGEEKDGAGAEKAGAVFTDFSLPKREPHHLKIASWNVAGFKAIMGKGFVEYVAAEDPDILCLQETKIEEEVALKEKLPAGYHAYFYPAASQKGHHGTGLLTKIKPISVKKGLGIDEHDDEGRCITAEFDKFFVVTTYTPNASRGLVNLDYRVNKWDVDFLKYLKKLEETKPVIWCGDLNVAHQPIDLRNPKTNTKTAGFTVQERESFSKILDSGFVDTFRHFYPNQEGAYTFWTYMGGAREKDVGWRLDYYIVSKSLMGSVVDTHIRKHVKGSDHAPIILLLNNN